MPGRGLSEQRPGRGVCLACEQQLKGQCGWSEWTRDRVREEVRSLISEAEILKILVLTLAFTLSEVGTYQTGWSRRMPKSDLPHKWIILDAKLKMDNFPFFLRQGGCRLGQKQKALLENYCNNLGGRYWWFKPRWQQWRGWEMVRWGCILKVELTGFAEGSEVNKWLWGFYSEQFKEWSFHLLKWEWALLRWEWTRPWEMQAHLGRWTKGQIEKEYQEFGFWNIEMPIRHLI